MTNANIVSAYRQNIVTLLSVMASLRDQELQISAEGGVSIFGAGDFVGANADLTAASFSSLVTSRQAVESLLAANGNAHYTNLMKARP